MKRIIFALGFIFFLAAFVSAEIIIDQQPKGTYNLGEKIDISFTVIATNGIYDFLKTSLICTNHIHFLPEEEISLSANEVIKISKSIFLIEKFIGNSLGDCKVKAWFQDSPENFIFTEEFRIVNNIEIELDVKKTEFNPGETVLIEGLARKGNEKFVNGVLDLSLMLTNSSENKTYQGVINEGIFSISFDLPRDIAAGEYTLRLNAYEKDPLEKITNKGFANTNILVNQIPTSLEIVFEDQEGTPGENLKVKAILHDQTGEKMDAKAIISIKNGDNKILEQTEKSTDEFLEFPILYNEPPQKWTVVAISTKLSNEVIFKIKEKESVKVDLINNTIILTNTGNVPYNKLVLVKIGEESMNINASLEVDEVKKYTLSAPDGEYYIEVVVEGESKLSKDLELTGRVFDIKESSKIIVLAKYPLVWFFMIFILGFIAFMIFRKGYKKSFIGRINLKNKERKPIFSGIKKDLIKIKNKAELSLSLSGEKQTASIVCLKIKNFKEIEKNSSSVSETLEKINRIVEESKVFVYENQEHLFFILAPTVTKTFDNEKNALKLAQKFEKLLKDHNKLFRQNINFGISVNSGEIISKKEGNVLKFMGFGNLIINAKKISSVSDSEVYLNEKMKEKLMPYAKLEKHKKQGIDIYTVKEMKSEGKEEHKKFISEFIKRLERGKDSEK